MHALKYKSLFIFKWFSFFLFPPFLFFISYIIEIEVFDLFNNDTNHDVSFISLYCLEGVKIFIFVSYFRVLLY